MTKVSKAMLVDSLATKLDMSKRDVEAVVEGTIAEITSQLQARNEVVFTGFGSLRLLTVLLVRV